MGGPPISVAAALDAASATDIVDGLPEGLDTEIPERGRTLSGGQRQRIVLAAAFLADPDVLILDEPTSAVDSYTEAAIADRMVVLRAGRTTVVVTTSPVMLERADRVVFLARKVKAVGLHRDLLHGDPDYRSVVTRGVPLGS